MQAQPEFTPYQRQAAGRDDLRLDANEGSLPGLPAEAWPLDSDSLRCYPDASALEAELAQFHGVAPEQVLVTAGADDAIDRACRRWLGPGRDLVLTEPTFGMFRRYARLAGARVRSLPWWQGSFPVAPLARAAGKGAGLLAVVSPNNPTGAVLAGRDLRDLRRACPEPVLLLDAAYTEFAENDLTAEALSLPRTLILRTFSKARGLAGLRVGYVLGPPPLVSELRAWGPPFAVAGSSLALARQALRQGTALLEENITAVRRNRRLLARRLEALGATCLPSQGNFLLCRPPAAGVLAPGLAALGVVVRSWPDDPLLGPWVRITVPAAPGPMERLLQALDTVLAPQALLFDLDGVLADVSESYRRCIRLVAAGVGVTLDDDDIARAKDRGQANNDWELTRRLLQERGVDLSLDEVTRRFQELYLGDADRPGLALREWPLVDRDRLLDLARSRPLAVVTGRPRTEALTFLERFDLTPFFREVICLEDAPAKPDPAPLRLALQRLKVERAWMLGDTPDDMVAARSAGVLPVGVCWGGSSGPDSRQALASAGAAFCLDTPDRLPEVLS